MHQEGIWAEVVSGDELQNAQKLEVPYSNIVFNGPYKTDDELELALREKIILNLDNFIELEKAETIARSLLMKGRVGLRISMGYSTGHLSGSDSKFGFSLKTGEVKRAIERVIESDVLVLEGLHFHLGTNLKHVDYHLKAIEEINAFFQGLTHSQRKRLRYIDIGGGFAIRENRPLDIEPQDWHVPSVNELAAEICTTINKVFPQETLLLVEPGRALIADSWWFVAKVIHVKHRQLGFYGILNGGSNLVPSTYYHAHPIEIISHTNPDERTTSINGTKVDFFGPLCMSIDLMASCQMTNPPNVGDIVIFQSIGAYNYSEAWTFSRGKPPVILLRTDGSLFTIRDSEPFNVLHHLEHLL